MLPHEDAAVEPRLRLTAENTGGSTDCVHAREAERTMNPANAACPACGSDRTIRTSSEVHCDYWYCFTCRKSFDTPHETDSPSRRALDTRRKIR